MLKLAIPSLLAGIPDLSLIFELVFKAYLFIAKVHTTNHLLNEPFSNYKITAL